MLNDKNQIITAKCEYIITTTWGDEQTVKAISDTHACGVAVAIFGKNVGMIVLNTKTNKAFKYLNNN